MKPLRSAAHNERLLWAGMGKPVRSLQSQRAVPYLIERRYNQVNARKILAEAEAKDVYHA